MLTPVFNPTALGLTASRLVGYDGTTFVSVGTLTYAASGTVLTVGGPLSCPGAGADSERFGAGATAAGAGGLAVGQGATCGGAGSVAVGQGATAPSPLHVSVGQNAASSNAAFSGVAVGGGAAITGNAGTAVGLFASAASSGVAVGALCTATTSSVAVGSGLSGTGTQTVKIGNNLDSATYTRVFMLGNAVSAAANDEVVVGYCQNAADPQAVRWVGRSSVQGRDLHRFDHTKLDSADATFTTRAVLSVASYGSLVEYLRAEGGTGAAEPKLGVLGATAIPRQLLATGAGASVDDVIAVLQAFGFCRQT